MAAGWVAEPVRVRLSHSQMAFSGAVPEQAFESPAELECTFIADAIGRNCDAEPILLDQHARLVQAYSIEVLEGDVDVTALK